MQKEKFIKNLLLLSVIVLSGVLIGRDGAYASAITGAADPSLSGAMVIDFSTESKAIHSSPLGIGNVTFSADRNFQIDDSLSGQYNVTGNYLASLGNDQFYSLVFSFTNDVKAFGFNLGGTDNQGKWNLEAYNASGSSLETWNIPVLEADNTGSFFGIAFDGIAYAKLVNTGELDYIVLDNFSYVTGDPAPEPATLVLFSLGLLGLARVGRSRR